MPLLEFVVYKDAQKQWRWSLRSKSNGKVIADSSEGYKRKRSARAMIDRIRGDAAGAEVIE